MTAVALAADFPRRPTPPASAVPVPAAATPATPGRRLCNHCGRRIASRPRILCWNCYYAPGGIREKYRSDAPRASCGRRGIGNGFAGYSLPDAPTTAVPGTVEKLAVLEERARMRRAIFHPADARFPGDPRPLAFIQSIVP